MDVRLLAQRGEPALEHGLLLGLKKALGETVLFILPLFFGGEIAGPELDENRSV